MTAKRIPHLPPRRYRSDGRLVDYSVSVKMVITNTKELTGGAYTWDSLSKSIEDKSPESVEDLVVIVQDITVDWEDYDYQLKQALAKGVTEEYLLEYFYNYTDGGGHNGVEIEYKTIYQKDNTPWGFFINTKAKEKLFRDILPFLLNPTQYFWDEIKGKIIAYAASNRNFDIEIFKLIDFISYIFAKKWELGKGECANDPVSENFTYPRLEPLTQAISYFNNALILTLSTTAKNLFENAKYPYQREMVKKITRINTLKDFVDLMENEEHPSEEEKQLLMLKVILLLDQYLREKGLENELTEQLLDALTEKHPQECKDLKIYDVLKIEGYKRLIEKYGHKIFKYDRPVCREWIKKLDTLRKIRAHGPAHSIRGASKYGLDEFKSILFGHSSDKVSFFEEIFRLKNVLT